MHILEIPSFLPPHGGLFCLEQARALQSLGHEVRVLSCTSLAVTIDHGFYLSARCDRWWETMMEVPCYRTFVRDLPRMVHANQRRWVATVVSMYDDYCRLYGRPDLIHAHCAKWAGVAARVIAQREGIPYYITEHLSSILHRQDFGPHWERHAWARALIRQSMEEARCVIPVSPELVEDLRPLFGADYRWQSISNIVDVDFFAAERKQGAKDSLYTIDSIETQETAEGQLPYRFVCLARADVYGKGLDLLSEAVAGHWLRDHQAELHLAGRGVSRLRPLFPQPEVHLYEELDREGVRDLLHRCDLLVLPSRCEAQPLSQFEAMSAGLPVLVSEAVPVSARIPSASTVVPVGDARALSQAMASLVGYRPEPVWLDEVRSKVSPVAVARQLEQLFLTTRA